jgi:hypothetical protein
MHAQKGNNAASSPPTTSTKVNSILIVQIYVNKGWRMSASVPTLIECRSPLIPSAARHWSWKRVERKWPIA